MFGFFSGTKRDTRSSDRDEESTVQDDVPPTRRHNNHHDDEDDHDDYDGTSHDEEDEENVKVEASLIPSDQEKRALLASFDTMRKDSLFCDVAFVCKGTLFRAHRVVVSSWSRWMRTFLVDSPPEEVLSMDLFEPDAFKAVLDYMYGQPLYLNVQKANNILKVVRRLELQKLEQQCWRYLMTVIDEDTEHVEYLHELADRYDCPPLKLAAWRILKERIPGVGAFPTKASLLKVAQGDTGRILRGTGLTGPGDPAFNNLNNINGIRSSRHVHQFEYDDYQATTNIPSIFEDYGDDEDDEDEDEDRDEEDEMERFNKKYRNIPALEELGTNAKATEVVMAWAKRLKEVYAQCAPIDAVDNDDLSQLKFKDDSPDVRLNKTTMKKSTAALSSSAAHYHQQHSLHSPNPNDLSASISVNQQADSPMRSTNATKRTMVPQPVPPPESPSGSQAGFMSASTPTRTKKTNAGNEDVNLPKYKSATTIDYTEVLTNFYNIMSMQEKIGGIPTILKTWKNKEDIMIASLMQKYDKTIPPHLMTYLDHVHALAENHTESSFVKPKRR